MSNVTETPDKGEPTPAPTDRAYPIHAPVEDKRFTLGLALDVAQILVDHGYPRVNSGGDLVALEQALFGFIYRPVSVADASGLGYSREADDPTTVSTARGLTVGAPLSHIAADGHKLDDETVREPLSCAERGPGHEPHDGHVYECCGKVGRFSPHKSFCTPGDW